jgi:glutathione synthase/RimK-type ligase-like ATP-grasp enzyme
MKKKFVFWRKLDGNAIEDNFSAKPEYHAFFNECNKNFDFRIANGTESYLGKGVFKNVWKYKDYKFVAAEKKFKANVIYQRKKVADDSFDNAIPLLDSVAFKKWCPDKMNQYELLKDLMPITFLINSAEDYKKCLLKITTEKAVLKPRRGQKGEDISVFYKINPVKLEETILKNKGYLLQEFHDTNVEVKGVVNGIHDIKLITVGKKIFANLRIPETGKEYCTFDSPYTEIELSKLPKQVFEVHKKVVERIKKRFPQDIYTVDIGLTKNGPIVFELNSHTAFPYTHFEYAMDFFNSLITHIKSLKV